MSTEERLDRIERTQVRILRLLEQQQPEFINEAGAMNILQRGARWLKNQRLGVGAMPPSLHIGIDWRYINGRTPEYKRTSITALKKLLTIRKPHSVTKTSNDAVLK